MGKIAYRLVCAMITAAVIIPMLSVVAIAAITNVGLDSLRWGDDHG